MIRKIYDKVMYYLGYCDIEELNRLEVIDEHGRSYVKHFKSGNIEFSKQDSGKTLEIFINK